MQVLAKLTAFPIFFRRGAPCAAPVASEIHVDDAVADAAYRVTDRLRRWTSARHFRDALGACRYAEATAGIVWERYVGPTGAVNWWSLNDEECALRVSADARPAAGAPPATAAASALSVV